MILKRIIPSIFLVSLLISCGSNVDLTATYKSPDKKEQQPYKNLFVSAAFASDTNRVLLEEAIEEELQEEKVAALTSHEIWAGTPAELNLAYGPLLQFLEVAQKDAVLTVSVIASASETRFVDTKNTYEPIAMNPWYRSYDEYYNHYGTVVYNPGYYAEGRQYFIEVNLYDVADETLIWSGQTQTYASADLLTMTGNIADLIVDELEEAQLILEVE